MISGLRIQTYYKSVQLLLKVAACDALGSLDIKPLVRYMVAVST